MLKTFGLVLSKVLCIIFLSLSSVSAALLEPEGLGITGDEIAGWTEEMQRWEDQQLTQPIANLLKNGQRKQAKLALAKYLTKYPNNVQAMEFAGTLLMEDKNYTAAIDAFVRVLKQYPGQNNVRTKLGISLVLLGEHEKGEKVLKQVLSRSANNKFALSYLSWLAQKQGDLQQAKQYLHHLVQLSNTKKVNDFHLALAQLYFNEKKYADVINVLKKPLAKSSSDSPAYLKANLLLANSYYYLGNIKAVEKIVRQINKKYSKEVGVHFLKALLARERKNYSAAVAIYQDVIKKMPLRANDAKWEIAKTYAVQGKPEKAVAVLEELVSSVQAGRINSVVRDMVAILSSAGMNDKALAVTEKYSDRFSDSADINYLKAEVLFLKGENQKALDYLHKVMFRFPDYLQGYLLASRIASEKSIIDAETILKLAANKNPKNKAAWIELANFYFRYNSIAKAEKVLSDAVTENKDDSTLVFELATVKDELGKKQEANDLYRKVIVNDPTHGAAIHNLLSNLADSKSGQKEALVIGQYALSNGMTDPFVLGAYGRVLLAAGDSAKALSVLNRAEKNITKELLQTDQVGIAVLYFHLGKAKKIAGDIRAAKAYFKKAEKMGLDAKYVEEIKNL